MSKGTGACRSDFSVPWGTAKRRAVDLRLFEGDREHAGELPGKACQEEG